MSSLTDSAAIFSYHREMITRHGSESSYALGWRDTESQLIRFKALIGIADLNGCSVLDAGCGYADLLPYLSHQYPNITYTGIEQIPELLDGAVKRYAELPATHFISGNFMVKDLAVADYVFASGSLNYQSVDAQFIFKAIARLYAACTKGLAFNMLKHVPDKGLLVAYDPAVIVDYCRQLGTDTLLIDGYADEDFTVYLYR